MRILLITHFVPEVLVGGTEVLTISLARRLQAMGHDVTIVCNADWDSEASYEFTRTDDVVRDIPVVRWHFGWAKAPHIFRYLYDNPEVATKLEALCHELKPDVAHVTSCYTLSASVFGALERAGVPMVFTATDFWMLCARNTLLQPDGSLCTGPDDGLKCAQCLLSASKAFQLTNTILPQAATEWLTRAVGRSSQLTNLRILRGRHGDWDHRLDFLLNRLRSLGHIVTASRFLKDEFVRYGVDPSHIRVLPYGLDLSRFQVRPKTPSPVLRLAFIGAMGALKGPDIAIRAVRSLPANLPVELKLYGRLEADPAFGAHLRELAGDDPRIKFCGVFDQMDFDKVMADVDVMLVPSIWYDFPLVVPSSLAMNTPVIVTDIDGLNELVRDGVDGLLFPRHDWRALADHITRLCEAPELLDRLRAGIRPIKTAASMAAEYLDLYAEVIARKVSV